MKTPPKTTTQEKQKPPIDGNGGESTGITLGLDVDTLQQMAAQVAAEGFVAASDLREKFGPERFTRGIAILYRQFRMFREVRRPYKGDKDALGYEWADRRFSRADRKRVPPVLGFILDMTSQSMPRYSDYQPVVVKCRWTNHVLGGIPKREEGGDDKNVFERDATGAILIPAYCLRAMTKKALPLIGKEMSIAQRIGFQAIRIESPKIEEARHGIVEEGRAGGKGIRRSEMMLAGTEFEIHAMVPTTALTIEEFLRMLTFAGKFVRLSPARSSGYGDFVLLMEKAA